MDWRNAPGGKPAWPTTGTSQPRTNWPQVTGAASCGAPETSPPPESPMAPGPAHDDQEPSGDAEPATTPLKACDGPATTSPTHSPCSALPDFAGTLRSWMAQHKGAAPAVGVTDIFLPTSTICVVKSRLPFGECLKSSVLVRVVSLPSVCERPQSPLRAGGRGGSCCRYHHSGLRSTGDGGTDRTAQREGFDRGR